MIPSTFNYHAPTTLADGIRLLSQYGDTAKVLAGGHSLIPMMKLRFAAPEHLIDLKRVQELKGIREQGGVIHIGAMTTESELIASELLWKKCPLIPEGARLIADPQVRNCGTIGGDIAHGDPGNDHPAIMLAVEASFVLKGPKGERVVPTSGFFLGMYSTQLQANEILTEIRVPAMAAGSGYAYSKLKRKAGDFATAAAAVLLQLDGKVCKKINIALTNAGPTALKATQAEKVLTGKVIDEQLIEQAIAQVLPICAPTECLRGDREYKTHMTGEMTRRAIRQALERAKGN